jgi:hypothetical protein
MLKTRRHPCPQRPWIYESHAPMQLQMHRQPRFFPSQFLTFSRFRCRSPIRLPSLRLAKIIPILKTCSETAVNILNQPARHGTLSRLDMIRLNPN